MWTWTIEENGIQQKVKVKYLMQLSRNQCVQMRTKHDWTQKHDEQLFG